MATIMGQYPKPARQFGVPYFLIKMMRSSIKYFCLPGTTAKEKMVEYTETQKKSNIDEYTGLHLKNFFLLIRHLKRILPNLGALSSKITLVCA